MASGKAGIIVAARTGSTRLPGKALLPLNGMPMILFLLERLKPVMGAGLALATTDLPADDRLVDLAEGAGVPVFRGSATDLIARYVAAAARFGFDIVGRVTGDCPFVDAAMVEHCMKQAVAFGDFDLATTKGTFPVGLDIELYAASTMARLNCLKGLSEGHREHLTLYMYDHKPDFTIRQLTPPANWPASNRNFTVDTLADYEAAQALAAPFSGARFSIDELIERAAA